jgi:hypothetical protein
MNYTTTTSYGTWCNQVNQYSTSPDSDVVDYISGGDSDWLELVEKSGALEEMQSAYRNAINEALPSSVSLCGDEFIGPAYPEDDDEVEDLDIKALVEDIDLADIVERYDPVTLQDIGRWELKSKAANPAKAAAAAMSRLGLKPYAYVPSASGRPQAIYLKGDVQGALAARPGRGKRTDLADA